MPPSGLVRHWFHVIRNGWSSSDHWLVPVLKHLYRQVTITLFIWSVKCSVLVAVNSCQKYLRPPQVFLSRRQYFSHTCRHQSCLTACQWCRLTLISSWDLSHYVASVVAKPNEKIRFWNNAHRLHRRSSMLAALLCVDHLHVGSAQGQHTSPLHIKV